ncbi:hypothetical protein JZ751_018890 [Albula glossodonta]|uniref:Uncharacterized protein n=1 Tax=Albula glossodonta TaxID=121402 RepID=A0A8T2MSY5_9TELE|nr:hypothetical protein JZ751_018890 [Albula glossodonta]
MDSSFAWGGEGEGDLRTTYGQDFLPPYVHNKKDNKVTCDQPEDPTRFRRRISQFTDAADYRRVGRNTWQDDGRVNRTMATKPTNPIFP